MKKGHLLKEEVLYYLKDEWKDSIEKIDGGLWLTTRALQKRLQDRGIITTWPTLNIRLNELLYDKLVIRIYSSAGECWRPITEDGSNTNND